MIPDVESQIGTADFEVLTRLVSQLEAKQVRNSLRADYYDMRNAFRDLGISIPPNLRNLEVAMGWPAKAVDALSRRVRMDGFVLPGGDVDAFGIRQVWDDNHMPVEAPQAVTSSMIHSVAFLATTLGQPDLGQPDVVLSTFDAREATGLWDNTRRGLSAFLGVIARKDGDYAHLVMLTPTTAYAFLRDGARWEVRGLRHGLGRVPVEPLVYRPRLGRPFGSSRISRAVMSITDSAMRTVVRSEVGAEFFSAPQRYLLGADEDAFIDSATGQQRSQWSLLVGRLLALDLVDEDGERIDPREIQIGQFPQVSMQPHGDHLRMWATLFAGETGLAVGSLGVVQDNPASAEAIYAAKEDLVIEAEACGEAYTTPLVRSMVTAVQMRDGLPVPPVELRQLGVRWRDPSTPSRAAATDAVMKQIAAGVLPPESDVALEALGYDETARRRIQSDRRLMKARELAATLAGAARDVAV